MSQCQLTDTSGPSNSRVPLAVVGLISAIAVAFLVWLIYFKSKAATHAAWLDALPWLNGFFNACAFLCLMRGYRAVKQKQIAKHRQSMLAALAFSTLFLLSYVTYHAFHAESHFLGQGWIRPVYFLILVSHVSLSMLSLPLVLSTLFLACTARIAAHRKIARWTFPLWSYVSITGVLIVVFLKGYGG